MNKDSKLGAVVVVVVVDVLVAVVVVLVVVAVEVIIVVLVPVEVVGVLVVDVFEASLGGPHLVKSDLSVGKEISALKNCLLMQDL